MRQRLLLSHGLLSGLAICLLGLALAYHSDSATIDTEEGSTVSSNIITLLGVALCLFSASIGLSLWVNRDVEKPLLRLTETLKRQDLQEALREFKAHASLAEIAALAEALESLESARLHHEKLREQIYQTQKMDAIGQLAGGVAHDFNNLLGGILGAADLLALRMDGSDERRKFVDMIAETAQRATDLTARLLAFSRRGGDVSHAVDIHKVINAALDELQDSTRNNGISVTCNLNADPPLVTGDASQLQHVFYQLGINSCEAMVDGGTLTISTELVTLEKAYCDASPFDIDPGRFIEILIKDTGIGMPHDLQHRIFEPFFSTKKAGKGRGLGLATVYGTVKDHLGAVTVNSELDKGTSFRICLPVELKSSITEPQATVQELSGKGAHILVVDDEEVIRITAENMLREMGYNVLFAANGMEAIEMFKRYQASIEAVILDLVMPVMDGHETLRALIELDSSVKVVISSGFACDAATREMLDGHGSVFLRKPFRQKDLMATLSKVLAPVDN